MSNRIKEKQTDVTVKDIFLVFLKIGTVAFGGVYSILAFFERELVNKLLFTIWQENPLITMRT